MRRAGLSLRSIAAALRCSLAEIHRLLKACVQGSPGLSDFNGVLVPSSENTDVSTSAIVSSVPRSRDVLTSLLSGSRAVVSAVGDDDEHVSTARSAESITSTDYNRGTGPRGKPTWANRRSAISSAASARSSRRYVSWSGHRKRSVAATARLLPPTLKSSIHPPI